MPHQAWVAPSCTYRLWPPPSSYRWIHLRYMLYNEIAALLPASSKLSLLASWLESFLWRAQLWLARLAGCLAGWADQLASWLRPTKAAWLGLAGWLPGDGRGVAWLPYWDTWVETMLLEDIFKWSHLRLFVLGQLGEGNLNSIDWAMCAVEPRIQGAKE